MAVAYVHRTPYALCDFLSIPILRSTSDSPTNHCFPEVLGVHELAGPCEISRLERDDDLERIADRALHAEHADPIELACGRMVVEGAAPFSVVQHTVPYVQGRQLI